MNACICSMTCDGVPTKALLGLIPRSLSDLTLASVGAQMQPPYHVRRSVAGLRLTSLQARSHSATFSRYCSIPVHEMFHQSAWRAIRRSIRGFEPPITIAGIGFGLGSFHA